MIRIVLRGERSMKAGDRVKFRAGAMGWKSRGLAVDNVEGSAIEIYRAPPRGHIKVDVKFDGSETVERGIDVEDLETVRHLTASFAG
jgi:hypothetical protein